MNAGRRLVEGRSGAGRAPDGGRSPIGGRSEVGRRSVDQYNDIIKSSEANNEKSKVPYIFSSIKTLCVFCSITCNHYFLK